MRTHVDNLLKHGAGLKHQKAAGKRPLFTAPGEFLRCSENPKVTFLQTIHSLAKRRGLLGEALPPSGHRWQSPPHLQPALLQREGGREGMATFAKFLFSSPKTSRVVLLSLAKALGKLCTKVFCWSQRRESSVHPPSSP